ncbi:hypothetical protein COCMIDRAFT_2774 [Bipolaris oryzae ATCC 44560]|uniref:Uncharacterized protein n=1 Tax=Bipolaris oryzae ATCC 44560 TaxID=930090 RepID=W6ZE94_COCMI|nr:uncharacterized protein COCMIDRAFT_2774 [Bipolaris oryzae ATCC 44560]EUC48330.1 hypothetical protein COCMIDRAFT_2774 [Bipolaris oryzae ATCC 44560]
MHLILKEDRPRFDNLASFKLSKIYEFVQEQHKQEENLNAMITDYSSVSIVQARKDAETLEEEVHVEEYAQAYQPKTTPEEVQRPEQQLKIATPKVDPAVASLIKKFSGLTLSIKQFKHISKHSRAIRKILEKPENYIEAYKQLVIGARKQDPPVLERNDGSFQSIYPPMMNPQAYRAEAGRGDQLAECRACGGPHLIAKCPHLTLLRKNSWFHTRTEESPSGWKNIIYYFGPYPTDIWGIFPGGGRSLKPFYTEVLDWVLRSIKDRFKVSDEQLKKPMQVALPELFDSLGKLIVKQPSIPSGESYTVEASETGATLARQTIALRSAAKFLESVSKAGEVYYAEPSVNVVRKRGRPPKKAAEAHQKDGRLSNRKPTIPVMKGS